MGTSWTYFKNYEIKSVDYEDERIYYLEDGDIDITFSTSAFLSTVLGHFDLLLPVYDIYYPPVSKKIDDLVDPQKVFEAAEKGIQLLTKEKNPFVNSFGYTERLFDEDDLRRESLEKLNANIIYYLEKIRDKSSEGFYWVKNWDR
ncbi:hypothetical protein ACQKNX_22885 [Lysinibacillus sp. NPDC093712]|uniref:hypothetical protein n=1 Tax=Lysinibacillus sp. NPDC093712 TaxID=3390579 RepID=UPI003D01F1CD